MSNLVKKYGLILGLITSLGVGSCGTKVNAASIIEMPTKVMAVDPTASDAEVSEDTEEEEDTEKYLKVPEILTIGKGETVSGFPGDNYKLVIISKSNGVKKVVTTGTDFVKGVSEGRCTIGFKSIENDDWLYREDGFSYQTTIVVKKAPKCIKVKKSKVTLKKGQSYALSASYSKGSTSYSKKAKIISGNDKITFKNGKVYGKEKGKGVVQLSTYNGKTAKITFTVK